MNAHRFLELTFPIILAALASIRFFFGPILRYSSFRRSLQRSSSRKLGVSNSLVLSQFLHSWNACTADGTATESVASCTDKTMPSLHPLGDQITTPVSDNIDTIANPITVEGIDLPGRRVVDGVHLFRNGHGLRSITYFGISIRIYVASMYSAKPILSAEQAMEKATQQNQDEDDGPLQLDFTFLRYVRQSQVVSAWTRQLGHSVTYREYDGYDADRDRFIELASGGPIENQGTQSVQLVGDETRIIDQGKLKGVIRGRDFQRSFLSMWFGSMAVCEDLKANLLLGHEHNSGDIQKSRGEVQQDLQQVLMT